MNAKRRERRSATVSFALFVILGFLVTTGIGISAIRLTIDRSVWQFQASMLEDEADVFTSAIRKIVILERNSLQLQTAGISPERIGVMHSATRNMLHDTAIFDSDARLLHKGTAFPTSDIASALRLVGPQGLSAVGDSKRSVLLAAGSVPGTLLYAIRQELSAGRTGYVVAIRPSPETLFTEAGYLTLRLNLNESPPRSALGLRASGEEALIQRPLAIANADVLLEVPIATLQAQRDVILEAISIAVFVGLAIAFGLIFGLGRRLIIRPINALQQSRQRLRQSEQEARRLAAALEETSDHIFISDGNGDLIWVNRAACAGTEYQREELLGRKAGDLLFGPETTGEIKAAVTEAKRNAKRVKFRSINYKKSGMTYIADVSITPIVNEDSGQTTFIAIERNATETQAAEERLRTAVEALNDGFAIADREGRFLIANAAYRQSISDLGATVEIGQSYADMIRRIADAGVANFGALTPEEWVAENVGKFESGHSRDFLVTDIAGSTMLRCHRRLPSGETVMMATDVTQLAEARRIAESAVEAKSRLTASISHELRTPLSGVISIAALLLEKDLASETRTSVELIKQSGEALLMIINDILDVSKLEQGRMSLRPAPFDTLSLAEDVCTLLSQTAFAKGLYLVLRFDPLMCRRLVGDAGRVRQVLLNLVGNAVKFTDSGGVTLRLSSEMQEGRCILTAEISDTGVGIAAADIEAVFVPFEQSQSLRATKAQEGTGLGLSICRDLARLMGGSLAAKSELGVGSVFTFQASLSCDATAKLKDEPDVSESHLNGRFSVAIAANAPLTAALKDQLAHLCPGTSVCDMLPNSEGGTSKVVRIVEHNDHSDDQFGLKSGAPPVILICRPNEVIAADLGVLQDQGGLVILHQPVRLSALRAALERFVGNRAVGSAREINDPASDPTPAKAGPVPIPVSVSNTAATGLPVVIAVEDNATNQFILTSMLAGQPFRLAVCGTATEALTLAAVEWPAVVLMDIHLPDMSGAAATIALHALQRRAGAVLSPVYGYSAGLSDAERCECEVAAMVGFIGKPAKKPDLLRAIASHIPSMRVETR